MAHDSFFVHHCNCITVLLISGFASAAIRLSFYTTSRLQPLDAGVIRNSKLKYREKLLKFVISRINDNVKVTDIIQEVDVLKAISWIKSARGEVSEETIVNCFKKCGLRKS